MWSKKAIEKLNNYSKPCGECMFCGHKDKRHRLWDAWLALRSMGAEWLANAYEVDIEYIKLVLQIKPYHRNNY